jgi:hypothetical protein
MKRHAAPIDLTGQQFGKLRVIGRAPRPETSKLESPYWQVECVNPDVHTETLRFAVSQYDLTRTNGTTQCRFCGAIQGARTKRDSRH